MPNSMNNNVDNNEELDEEGVIKSAEEGNEPETPRRHNPYRAFIIVLVAILIVAGVSLLPLSQMTGGKIKDFNLLSDILNIDPRSDTTLTGSATDGMDPELVKAMNASSADTAVPDDSVLIDIKPARVGDIVQIEDYTHQQKGLCRLREALSSGRLARVAVLGDSYIEGDIFTQDLRDQLQTRYGGSGVGYMNMHSDFPGFRRSIKQSGKGWTEFAAGKKGKSEYFGLSEHYHTPAGEATAIYKGTSSLANTSAWDTSRFLFIAPSGAVIKTKTNGEAWTVNNVKASPEVQQIIMPGNTTEFSIEANTPSLIGLGVWLDADKGISVDCMSSRGFSGISLAKIDSLLCNQMSKFIDYDLIVLEFGINAMSATQKDYSVYAGRMAKVVKKIRNCYPNADILIMGVGDRGEKKGSAVLSMSTGPLMIDAQRDLARRTHAFFWDTREAMGGDGAIAKWSKNGLANKDYVHLTHKGGKELATALSKAIERNLNL